VENRAPRNKTINITEDEQKLYLNNTIRLDRKADISEVINKTICQDVNEACEMLPDKFIDLMIADPPYNLTKTFGNLSFRMRSYNKYVEYIDNWLSGMVRLLKDDASIYVCGDWRCSSAIQSVLAKYFNIRNRITWEREKGRGSLQNWKNASEDIWFATVSDKYKFNLDDVKLSKRVIAPYKNGDGTPKDWTQELEGKYRLTCPSNLWTDITVPFWSMSENTDHPTQKPEKLLAKLILASSDKGDIIFDPFLGSGSTSVTAMKLQRRYVGIEIDETYCCLAEKRLHMARENKNIQGYANGIFYERNSRKEIKDTKEDPSRDSLINTLKM
jgi:site-specific DNA-methyltransferase (adenine-specific)